MPADLPARIQERAHSTCPQSRRQTRHESQFSDVSDILIHVTRSDGGTYDQSNDYSYNGSGSALMDTTRITVYYKGALICGTEL